MKFQFTRRTLSYVLIGFSALVVVMLFSIYTAYAVYVKRDDSRLIRIVGSWLPAASVGGKTISYGSFLDTRDTVRTYLSSDAAKENGLAVPITPEVEKNAFDRLIREVITNQMAKERNVTVPDEAIREQFAEMILATSSTIPNIAQYLADNFHWTEEQFREKVMRPSLLEEALSIDLASSTPPGDLETEIQKRLSQPDVKTYLTFKLN